MKKIFLLSFLSLLTFSCNEDNDDNLPTNATVSFLYSHNWDGTELNATNFDTQEYTNANGEILNITRLRYLTSRYELTNASGETFLLNGYNLVDIADTNTHTFQPENLIPVGTYTLKIIWGFNETDNQDGAYTDLNSASWNWPAMLGGGYHFMQFDGMYNVNTAAPKPFNYHNGTAKVSDGVFEQNFVTLEFAPPIVITNNTTIEMKMNIAEWFKNPYTWDLNIYDTPLMPNYDAQKLMQQNAETVFSIGTISE
ncbi:MAG: MbnP family protein [Oceanihabitans sp.]